jgi:CubicO group peptidase (beta-lactamase class C family)
MSKIHASDRDGAASGRRSKGGRRWRTAVLLLIAAGQPAYSAAPYEDLQRYVQQSLPAWQTPGLSLSLVKDGKVVFSKGFGVRAVGDSAKVDENTLFGIGSCSKAFGSAGVAALVGDGTVGWDERLRKYLPDLALWDPWVTDHITVRDMLSHRTGTSLDVEANGMPTIRRPEEWVERLRFEKPAAGFREKYVYSNAMYVASALMVERLTGREWNDFAAERLWRPLHMERTNGSLEKTLQDPNHAAPHFLIDGRLQTSDVQLFAPGTIPATGNVMSTAHDMGRWLLFQLGEGTVDNQVIVPAGALHETHAPQIPIRGGPREAAYYFEQIDSEVLKTRDWSYGMGWFINDYRGQKMLWHGGTVPGFRCMVGFMPEANVGVYVGVNRTSLLPVALFFRAIDDLLRAPATDWSRVFEKETQYQDAQSLAAKRRKAATRVAGTQPSLPLDRYEGTYSNDAFGDLSVTRQADSLRVVWGLRSGRLVHWNYDTFEISWDRPEFEDRPLITFQLDSAGRAANAGFEDVGTFNRRPGLK